MPLPINDSQYPRNLQEEMRSPNPHSHYCLIYEEKKEWFETVVSFIKSDIDSGEACIYVVDQNDTAHIKRIFDHAGLDMEECLQSGAFSIVKSSDAYTKHRHFDPDSMVELLILRVKSSLGKGYRAFRITGEMPWALHDASRVDQLLEYQAKLNDRLISIYPCIALSQYDLTKFDVSFLRSCLFTHPMLIRNKRVYQNTYRIEPNEYIESQKKDLLEIRCLLDNLEKQQADLKALEERDAEYRRLFETMSQGVIYQDAKGHIVSANPAAERILGLTFDQMQGKSSMDAHWQMIREDGTKVCGKEHPAMIALATGQKVGPVTRGIFHHQKNTHIWLQITAIPLFQPGEPKPFQVYATIEDISVRKKMEDALRKNELLMKTTMDNLPIGIAINTVFPKVNFEYMNEHFVKFYRTTRQDLAKNDHFWDAVYEDPEYRDTLKKRVLEDCASGDTKRMIWENIPITRSGEETTYITAMNIPVEDHSFMISVVMDVTKQYKQDQELKRIEWMLDADRADHVRDTLFNARTAQNDLAEHNTYRLILDTVGENMLADIVQDFLHLMETSAAIYEKNGDYAFGTLSSGWCRLLDCASRKLCDTKDDREALDSGEWLCHESCWTGCSKIAIETDRPVDITCNGGLRLYGVPIRANNQVIGSINFGYGSPPKDRQTLQALSKKYDVSVKELETQAHAYETRPPFITQIAKERIHSSARLIGALVEHKLMERTMKQSLSRFEALLNNSPSIITLFDETGKYHEVSSSAANLLGLTPQTMRGKNFRDLLPAKNADSFMHAIHKIKKDGQSIETTDSFRVGDDEKVYESVIFPIESADLATKLYGSIADDVTKRIKAEQAMQRHLTEMESMLRILTSLRKTNNLQEMLNIILDETLDILDAKNGAIRFSSPDNTSISGYTHRGWPDPKAGFFDPWEDASENVLLLKKIIVSSAYVNDPTVKKCKNLKKGWGGVFVPLYAEERVVGILNVSVPLPRKISRQEQSLLKALSEAAGSALHRLSLYEEAGNRMRQLQSLRSIDQSIIGSLDLKLTLNVVLDQVVGHLKVDAACIFLMHPHLKLLEFYAGKGLKTKTLENLRLRLGETCAGKAALKRKIYQEEKRETHDDTCSRILDDEGFATCIAVPLLSKGEVIGVLQVFHKEERTNRSDWLEFLEILAAQSAIAIDNARLFDDIQAANLELTLAYDATLEGWAKALELRDYETQGHSRRVAHMTLTLARCLQISEKHMANMYRGALLHDIGKMGISDHILLKPGKLSDEEWILMKRHPEFAFEMLSSITYLRSAVDIPYCHHEKWDGSGYPRGLQGNSIPIEARVFAGIDVFDAMTNDRPYRKALSKENALQYIKEQRGSHFDPKVVDAFLQCIADELI